MNSTDTSIKKQSSKKEDMENIILLKKSAYFDAKYYLKKYEDVATLNARPEHHYYHFGWREGRNPNHIFKTNEYIIDYEDVLKSRECPLIHYLKQGLVQGRRVTRNIDIKEYSHIKILDCNRLIPKTTLRVCVLLHLEPCDSIFLALKYIKNIPTFIDIYISTDTDEKIIQINECLKENEIDNKINIIKMKNVGMDTAALLIGFNEIVRQYDLFCFTHFNFSEQALWEHKWREFLFNNLLGCKQGIEEIIDLFGTNPKLGIIFPPKYPTFLGEDLWDKFNYKSKTEKLIKKICNCKYDITIADKFPLGGMFWARTPAVIDAFNMNLKYDDFGVSDGIDGSLRCCVERMWNIISTHNGYTGQEVMIPYRDLTTRQSCLEYKKRLVLFVCVELNENVLFSCKELLKVSSKVVLILNSDAEPSNLQDFNSFCTVLLRPNVGFDFGAWREAINVVGYDEISKYDELILCNDSCFFPIVSLDAMFADMENIDCDFWGNTLFPQNHMYDDHIQSYFFCFKNNVFTSNIFKNFFASIIDLEIIKDVVVQYEIILTKKLGDAGFKYSCHIFNTTHIYHFTLTQYPLANLIMGNNFIKKKCFVFILDYQDLFMAYVIKLFNFDIKSHVKVLVAFMKKNSNICETSPQLAEQSTGNGSEKNSEKNPREYFKEYLLNVNSVLEIGPFTIPFCAGSRVKYFDVMDSKALLERAKALNCPINSPPEEVHFVSQTGDLSIVNEKFDVVFSSHCLEHQLDIIQHLKDAFSLLNDNGKYFMVIPDARYCFDHFRPISTLTDIICANFVKNSNHTLKSHLEMNLLMAHNDPARHWNNDHAMPCVTLDIYKNLITQYFDQYKNVYIDIHAFCFSDEHFLYCIKSLYYLGYIDCLPFAYYPTLQNAFEFGCVLKIPTPHNTSKPFKLYDNIELFTVYENCSRKGHSFVPHADFSPTINIVQPFQKDSDIFIINFTIKSQKDTYLTVYYSQDRCSFEDEKSFSYPIKNGVNTMDIHIPTKELADIFYLRIVPVEPLISFEIS